MANNINRIFDEYDSEDYLCYKLKPKGMLRCGYCHDYYESSVDDSCPENVLVVCKNCGEVSFPYEET